MDKTKDSQPELIRLNKAHDLIFVTVGLYRAFLAKGDVGRDALALYLHLFFVCRVQETNSVWATDKFLKDKKGLGWGREKLMRAKSLLHSMGLIEYVQRAGQDGRFGKTYIELHGAFNPSANTAGPENRLTADRTTGPGTQVLEGVPEMLEGGRKDPPLVAAAPASTPPHGLREATDLFQARYLNVYPVKPTFDAKVIKLLKADLCRLGFDRWQWCVESFFDDPPRFVKEKGTGLGYNIFHALIDQLVDRIAKRQEKPRPRSGGDEEAKHRAEALRAREEPGAEEIERAAYASLPRDMVPANSTAASSRDADQKPA